MTSSVVQISERCRFDKTSPCRAQELYKKYLEGTMQMPEFVDNYILVQNKIKMYSDEHLVPVVEALLPSIKETLHAKPMVCELKPIRKHIDLDLVLGELKAYGYPNGDGRMGTQPFYVTRDGYILDGHKRWAGAMLYNRGYEVLVEVTDFTKKDLEYLSHIYVFSTPNANLYETFKSITV